MTNPSSPHPAEALLKATSLEERHPRGTPVRTIPAACTIAISREAGALGSSVGQELATRLGWRLLDQALLDRIGSEMGLRSSLLASVDERPTDWVREFVEGFASRRPRASSLRYGHHLLKVLGSLAVGGECIIVGRGAPHILPVESTLRVRLVAPIAFRVATIQKAQGQTAEKARHWIDETDRERVRFVKETCGIDPTDPGQYDLVLNVARFTVPETASIIIDALRNLEQHRARG